MTSFSARPPSQKIHHQGVARRGLGPLLFGGGLKGGGNIKFQGVLKTTTSARYRYLNLDFSINFNQFFLIDSNLHGMNCYIYCIIFWYFNPAYTCTIKPNKAIIFWYFGLLTRRLCILGKWKKKKKKICPQKNSVLSWNMLLIIRLVKETSQ
jgi:hypothetical protein